MNVSFSDFVDTPLDSLSWYNFLLNSGDISIVEIPSGFTFEYAYASILSSLCSIDELILSLDILSALIINDDQSLGCSSLNLDFDLLVYVASRLMSINLTSSGSRPVRMRAQRLNYLLQAHPNCIFGNKSLSSIHTQEENLPYQKPWDFYFADDLKIFISSDSSNIHIQRLGCSSSYAFGLPTQVSKFEDEIIFGSIYSPGFAAYRDDSIVSVEFPQPILLLFIFKDKKCALSHFGVVYCLSTREVMLELPLAQVHFARIIDNKLFCLDNSSFGLVHSLCCLSGEFKCHPVYPVMVCNDICLHRNRYFLIDKQQGSVFEFDKYFKYISRSLDYGYSASNLADPVAIHSFGGRLHILSWLTSKITSFQPF